MKCSGISQGYAGNGVAFRIEKKTAEQGHTVWYVPGVRCFGPSFYMRMALFFDFEGG